MSKNTDPYAAACGLDQEILHLETHGIGADDIKLNKNFVLRRVDRGENRIKSFLPINE